MTAATEKALYLSGLYSAASAAWLASMAPAPRPLMKRSRMNSISVLAVAVKMIETPISATDIMISLRRPMMSETGARNIAPAIMPASAKLKIQPSLSGVSSRSAETGLATTAMAVMSKPSSMLKKKQSPTTSSCWTLTPPRSMTSWDRSSLLWAAVDIGGLRSGGRRPG